MAKERRVQYFQDQEASMVAASMATCNNGDNFTVVVGGSAYAQSVKCVSVPMLVIV